MSNEDSGNTGEAPTLFQLLRNNPDHVIIGREPTIEKTTPDTGMDRLRRIFSLDQYGYQTKELVMITQTMYTSTLAGGVIGAIIQSRTAFLNFLENNQATKFHSQIEAKRELQRVMYLAFGKGALRWGWRIGAFSVSFVSLMTMVSVYRGKESLVEYLVAGGVTGGLFKMNLGLKGALSGCLVGTVLGAIGGGASLLVLKLGGTSMDEIRSFTQGLKQSREAAIREKRMVSSEGENTMLANKKGDDELYFQNLTVDEVEEGEK